MMAKIIVPIIEKDKVSIYFGTKVEISKKK